MGQELTVDLRTFSTADSPWRTSVPWRRRFNANNSAIGAKNLSDPTRSLQIRFAIVPTDAFALTGRGTLRGQWCCSREVGLKQKQQSVRRNVQIEIDKAVQQEPAERGDRPCMDRARKMTLFGLEALACVARKYPQERESARPPRTPVSASNST